MSDFGSKLNPERKFREPHAIKAQRQSIRVSNNPSSVSQNERLSVVFPILGDNDVVVPGTVRLAFTITLKQRAGDKDSECIVVQNIGRNIVNKIVIKINNKEIQSISDSDIFYSYMDLWKTSKERTNLHYQGIDTSEDRNVTKLRFNSTDADSSITKDKAIADVLKNRFYIPLDNEILESHCPFLQSAFDDRLIYEFTFNKFENVLMGANNMIYEINDLELEFDTVSDYSLAKEISSMYSQYPILFDRVVLQRMMPLNKSDTTWNFNFNVPIASLKGVLFLFKEPQVDYQNNTDKFYNPKILDVKTTIDGVPNQIYSQNMKSHNLWDEIKKLPVIKDDKSADKVGKKFWVSDIDMGDYYDDKFALWVDFRSTEDNSLHGSGRKIKDDLSISISKTRENSGDLTAYIYLIMDAQLNIVDSRLNDIIY